MKEKEQLNSPFQGSFHITHLQTNGNEDVVISITKGHLWSVILHTALAHCQKARDSSWCRSDVYRGKLKIEQKNPLKIECIRKNSNIQYAYHLQCRLINNLLEKRFLEHVSSPCRPGNCFHIELLRFISTDMVHIIF